MVFMSIFCSPLNTCTIQDSFWSKILDNLRKSGIPYMWQALNDQLDDAANSYCMKNFHIASGKEKGEHNGNVFQDSDVAKWLEAVAYSLTWHPDKELEQIADNAISDIIAAQLPDGYLNTYYTINGIENRWTNLTDSHELYCAGHMIEAAVAYYHATGKREFLDAMCRFADHIDSVFGKEEGKIPGYPGHPVIEMALVKLSDATNNKKYLDLASYFINQRGQQPIYFYEECKKYGHVSKWLAKDNLLGAQYYQAGRPVREQTEAVGHAVRMMYLCSAIADIAYKRDDEELKQVCDRLWDNTTLKRMYITGAIGSSSYGESFTFDYDLPNDTIYGETCAAIGLIFFAHRMLLLNLDSKYSDVIERVLYNCVLSSVQLDCKRFFYVNPLETVPEASRHDAKRNHVVISRQKWLSCACCPPNLLRLTMSLQQYIYSIYENLLAIHLYISGQIRATINETPVELEMKSDYPWNGKINISVKPEQKTAFPIALRIPCWCKEFNIKINHQPAEYQMKNGYAIIDQTWKKNDSIVLEMPMPVSIYRSNPLVRDNIGMVAVGRGPIIYCLEQDDNRDHLHLLSLGDAKPEDFKIIDRPDLLGGIVQLQSIGKRIKANWNQEALYRSDTPHQSEDVILTWIPYYAWSNRTPGEMRVWIRE